MASGVWQMGREMMIWFSLSICGWEKAKVIHWQGDGFLRHLAADKSGKQVIHIWRRVSGDKILTPAQEYKGDT